MKSNSREIQAYKEKQSLFRFQKKIKDIIYKNWAREQFYQTQNITNESLI